MGASTASAVRVVDLSPTAAAAAEAAIQPDNCDGSTPLILADGVLKSLSGTLGKLPGVPGALLGALNDQPDNQINRTFSLNQGILSWDIDDEGAGTFYSCGGALMVDFGGGVPGPDCVEVVVGAIAGKECSSVVEQTSTVAAAFVAPTIETESTISSTQSQEPDLSTTAFEQISLTFTTPEASPDPISATSPFASQTASDSFSDQTSASINSATATASMTGTETYTAASTYGTASTDVASSSEFAVNPLLFSTTVPTETPSTSPESTTSSDVASSGFSSFSIISPTISTLSFDASSYGQSSSSSTELSSTSALDPTSASFFGSSPTSTISEISSSTSREGASSTLTPTERLTLTTTGSTTQVPAQTSSMTPAESSTTASVGTSTPSPLTLPTVSSAVDSLASSQTTSINSLGSTASFGSSTVGAGVSSTAFSSNALSSISSAASQPSTASLSSFLNSATLSAFSSSYSGFGSTVPSPTSQTVRIVSSSNPQIMSTMSSSKNGISSIAPSPSAGSSSIIGSSSNLHTPSTVSSSNPGSSLTVASSISGLPSTVSSLARSYTITFVSTSSITQQSFSGPSLTLPPASSIQSYSTSFISTSNAIQRTTSAFSTSRAPLSSSSSSAGCSLPQACADMRGKDILSGLPTTYSACVLAVGSDNPRVSSCFPQSILPGTQATSIADCIEAALCSPTTLATPTSTAVATTASTAVATTASTAASASTPTSLRLSSTSASSPTSMPYSCPLPNDCLSMAGLNGLALLTRLNLCASALGATASVPGAAQCLNADTSQIADGVSIVDCLNLSLCPSSTSSVLASSSVATRMSTGASASSSAPATLATASAPLSSSTPYNCPLPLDCTSMTGLISAALASKRALCTLALGGTADIPTVAQCLSLNVGVSGDGVQIVDCLNLVLCPSDASYRSTSASVTPPESTTASAKSLTAVVSSTFSVPPTTSASSCSLPDGCNALSALSGLSLNAQLSLCNLALGAVASQPGVSSCLGVTVGSSTPGGPIVDCLQVALCPSNVGSRSTTMSATTSVSMPITLTSTSPADASVSSSLTTMSAPGTSPATAPCTIPNQCDILRAFTGAVLSTQLPGCQVALGLRASETNVALCLPVSIDQSTIGANIADCLMIALCSPNSVSSSTSLISSISASVIESGGVSSTATSVAASGTILSSTASAPSATTSTGPCALPDACIRMRLFGGLDPDLQTQRGLCLSSLGGLASNANVISCLAVTINTNTIGGDFVDCLEVALCPSNAALRSTSVSATTLTSLAPSETVSSSTMSAPSGTTSTVCSLPDACAAFRGLNGLLMTQKGLCISELGVSRAAEPSVVLCLAAADIPNAVGVGIADCLQLASCPLAAASTTNPSSVYLAATTSTPVAVVSSSTFAAPATSASASCLPAVCNAFRGIDVLSLASQITICRLALDVRAPTAETCFQINQNTVGATIADCLELSLCSSNPELGSTSTITTVQGNTAATTTITTGATSIGATISAAASVSTASSSPLPDCVANLPQSCSNIASFAPVDLFAASVICNTDLGFLLSSLGISNANICLDGTGILTNLVTPQDVQECLYVNVACSRPVLPTPSTRVSQTANAVPSTSPRPTCLSTLPGDCTVLTAAIPGNVIPGSAGNVGPLAQTCLLSIGLGNLAGTGLLNARICLNPAAISSSTTGPSLLACLNTGVLCPASVVPSFTITSTVRSSQAVVSSLTPTTSPATTSTWALATASAAISTASTAVVASSRTSTTSASPSASPAVQCSITDLPFSCGLLTYVVDFASPPATLIMKAATCSAALVTAGAVDALPCLAGNNISANVTGARGTDLLTCINNSGILCPVPPRKPNCFSVLPTACSSLSAFNGNALGVPLSPGSPQGLCSAALRASGGGLSAAALPRADACLNPGPRDFPLSPITLGSDIVSCLTNAAVCGDAGSFLFQ